MFAREWAVVALVLIMLVLALLQSKIEWAWEIAGGVADSAVCSASLTFSVSCLLLLREVEVVLTYPTLSLVVNGPGPHSWGTQLKNSGPIVVFVDVYV